MYNESSHRQVLGPTRISKASARQRAGRTGRVREGSVYRLYSRTTFELHMDPFETGEILRMPLDSVILSIKDMIPDEGISDLLSRLIEPPGQGNIERSLEALFRQKFLTAACESSNLTSLGSFVVAVGIDLCLGTFIGLGFVLGLPAESISFAAILSFPKSPWSIGNASFHELSKYNGTDHLHLCCMFVTSFFSEVYGCSVSLLSSSRYHY
jgi:HrpA-like RNA helicase